MSLAERLYLPAILNGMSITFRHMFKKTRRYAILSKSINSLLYITWSACIKRDDAGRDVLPAVFVQ